jgi:DNA-binding response OmpR family regulator
MRILIAEYHLPLSTAISQGLREAGYAVDVTADGAEAFGFACSNPYSLIIFDIMLPGLDGLSVLRQLRQADCTSHVLLLTARDRVEDCIAGLDLGADDDLVKPFAFLELMARVSALVRRTHQVKSPIVQIGPLSIDTVDRCALSHGADLDLTVREFAILEFLAVRKGCIVTRSQLEEHLYDFKHGGGSNVIDVYSGYVRRKPVAHGCAELIHIRRGLGYVLGDVE